MLIDSHCHLNFSDFENDIDEVLAKAQANQVAAMLCISTMLEDFAEVIKITASFPNIFATVGTHPSNANKTHFLTAEKIQALCAHPKVIGIGETGLDYYHPNFNKDVQIEVFSQHIKAAQNTGLPLVVHTRNAASDTLEIMRDYLKIQKYKAVIHCFSESMEFAHEALDMGFYISFSGILTFKNAYSLHEVAQVTPLERILVETDAPYLAPVPHRGKRNEPSYVTYTAKFLADLKNVSYIQICDTTTNNFYKLFSKAKG